MVRFELTGRDLLLHYGIGICLGMLLAKAIEYALGM